MENKKKYELVLKAYHNAYAKYSNFSVGALVITKDDNYYFHYDLIDEKLGTARLENLINISSNRIREPYYINNKIATITKKDNDAILKIIKKYYAFEEIKETNKNIRKHNIIYKSKENREKVLT